MAAPLATETTSVPQEMVDLEQNGQAERARWVLNPPEPPSFWFELVGSVRDALLPDGSELLRSFKNGEHVFKPFVSVLQAIFPILVWSRNYKATKFKNDVLAGLTLASLCIPQGIGYATLAKLDPQYGLYTSVIPPLIYAMMGTSREIAIGPVAVVSLLLSSMIQKIEDPVSNPIAYRNLVLTATFFAGIFQATFGIFRLGFLVDFLSHSAIVGFMAGAAIVIGLQQLKGLLGISHFTNKTDIISVLKATCISANHSGRKNKKLFWLPAIAPLVSVILSTLIVYLTRADKHGVNIIKHIKGGLNPSSIHHLQFTHPHIGQIAKIALIVAAVALTEAIAVGRSFAAVKGYQLDGNKEMVAMGVMNIFGSISSCYVATGSFSRSAVNISAGCETAVSNIVMAITVMICLEFMTRLLYFTPVAILASIILSALPGLIDVHEICNIWKVDKLDFLACVGAFLGVLFASVEIGLLAAVAISFMKIIIISVGAGTEIVGRIPGTEVFGDVDQYPMAIKTPPVLIIRVKSGFLCFANANFVKQKIMKWATMEEEDDTKGNRKRTFQLVILDMSNLTNIDIAGIASLKELHKNLISNGIELAIINPKWQVIQKLILSNFVSKIGGKIFLTVGEAVDACLHPKITAI
ncbi:sulfate transporter 2.1-like isoform X2 [Mercurialis annua]|uniref:sulfate transporter 2.1-like isoform X2 n=1 Tax=Mercurialis annua TaxID=3986 RepID=UPI0024AD5A21|nr:sulfate transporter 2.1-like isoform X2 [Mercurialis annua]